MAKRKRKVSCQGKGSSFERKLAVMFSHWWTNGERDDIFWRTDSSGSRATNRARRGKRTKYQYGDMTFTDPIGTPLIEALNFEFKCRKGYEVLSVLHQTDPNNSLLEFWTESWADAEISHRCPVLITKQNNHPEIMWINIRLYNALSALGFIPAARMTINIPGQTVRMMRNKTIELPDQVIVGFRLSVFLDTVPPAGIKELLNGIGTRSDSKDAGSESSCCKGTAGEACSCNSGGCKAAVGEDVIGSGAATVVSNDPGGPSDDSVGIVKDV